MALIADLLTQLNTALRDSDNFTFTVAEKTEALRSAIEDDPMVYIVDTDSSNTLVANTYSYPTPFETTLQIGYDAYSDGSFEPILRGYWEEYNGNIIIDRTAELPAGKKLYLRGLSPLKSTANVPGTMRKYIVASATVACVDMLMESKVNRFNRNDATMAEMQMVRQNALQTVNRLRSRLRNKRTVRF